MLFIHSRIYYNVHTVRDILQYSHSTFYVLSYTINRLPRLYFLKRVIDEKISAVCFLFLSVTSKISDFRKR